MSSLRRCTGHRVHRGTSSSGSSRVIHRRAPFLLVAALMLLVAFTAPIAHAAEPVLHLDTAEAVSFSEIEVSGTAEVQGGEAIFIVAQALADEEGEPVEFEVIQEIPEGTTATVPVNGIIHRLHPDTTYFIRLKSETVTEKQTLSAKPYLSVTTPPEPPALPQITDEEVTSVGANSATLNARITPERAEATYQFEWLTTQAFAAEGWSSPTVERSGVVGTLPADSEQHAVSFQLQGLVPGVQYVWRASAENVVGTAVGATASVGTYRPSEVTPFIAACPNQSFRVGLAGRLPDCRAYEQVTPSNKGGLNVQGFASYLRGSADANAPSASFMDLGGSGIPATGGARQDLTSLLAARSGETWTTQRLFPGEGEAERASVRGMSPNLRFVVDEVGAEGEGQPASAGLILIDAATGKASTVVQDQTEVKGERSFSTDAIGEDGSYVIFETAAVLAPGAISSVTNLYRWSRATGAIELVGILPSAEGGEAPPGGAFGGREGGSSQNFYVEPLHAATVDGTQIYFSVGFSSQLYLRSGLGGPGPVTTRVSTPNPGVVDHYVEEELFGEPLPAVFQEATPSGRNAFFLSSQKLTADATTGEFDGGTDLYRFDSGTDRLVDVTGGFETLPNGARVVAMLGAGSDGRSGFFVAEGALEEGAIDGRPNIYHFEESESGNFTITFVATLRQGGTDALNWSNRTFNGNTEAVEPPQGRSSRVSQDGTELFFSSKAAVTGYENRGCGRDQKEACIEIYRYSATDDHLGCVSCTPTGETSLGNAYMSVVQLNASSFVSTTPAASYLTRNISADGDQFFFQTPDSLVSDDENGKSCKYNIHDETLGNAFPSCQDVYEWEAVGAPGGSCTVAEVSGGCVYLLSAADSAGPASFIDASSDGSNAYIATSSPLVPADRDELFDIYDVRAGGGLASQFNGPTPPCEAEACRSETHAASISATPGSSILVGPGNLRQPRCQKHQGKNGKNCKKHGKKKHGKKKHRKSQAMRGQAASGKGGQ